jgi:hypothetical protein
MRLDAHEDIPGWGHGRNHVELTGQKRFRDANEWWESGKLSL